MLKLLVLEYRIKFLESINRKQEYRQREFNYVPSYEKSPDVIGYRISAEAEADCTLISNIIA